MYKNNRNFCTFSAFSCFTVTGLPFYGFNGKLFDRKCLRQKIKKERDYACI